MVAEGELNQLVAVPGSVLRFWVRYLCRLPPPGVTGLFACTR
jgi:hypothetical protein